MSQVKCPVCNGKGIEADGLTCAFCVDGLVSEEARRQYLEYLEKKPVTREQLREIFRPIKPE